MKSTLDHQNLEIGLQRQIDEIDSTVVRTDFTTVTPPDSGDILTQLGVNYLDNSDLDFSKDAYVNSTPAGGDVAEECYNFYRQRFIRISDAVLVNASATLTSASSPFKSTYSYPMLFFALSAGTSEKALIGTITRVSDTTATMSVPSQADLSNAIVFFGDAYAETSANSLKSSTHSLFAANEALNDSIPQWDKTAGQAEIGGNGVDNYDLAIPLPFNLATRGLELFFSVNVKLKSGSDADQPIIFYVGVYDTTSGNESFLEADNFDLTVNYIGTAGANEYEMIVIGRFSNGQEVASDVVTVSNVGTLDADNYLDWDWNNAPRILDYSLYRRDTGTGDVVRVFTIYNGETRYFDKDVDGSAAVVSFPTAPARREYAYAESLPFYPTSDYRRIPIFFRIPPTYAQSNTTNRQILRIGVYNDAGNDVRPLIIDRPILSLTESVWNRSTRDLERIQTTAPTATVPDGNQFPYCVAGDVKIIVKDRPDENWRYIEIRDARKGMWIYDGQREDRIVAVKEGMGRTFKVALSSDISIECTASERFITSSSDRTGTRLDKLAVGDVIISTIDGVNYQSKIESIQISSMQKVHTLSLERGKIFLAGNYKPRWWKSPVRWGKNLLFPVLAGAKLHNRKQDYEFL